MLSDLDDLLVHQSSQTIAYPATTDLRFFERFYFNVHDRNGQFSVSTGLGAYPNLNSMDGFVCGIRKEENKQYNGRFFRELHFDRTDSKAGPLKFSILEPMRRWRLSLGENPYGIEFDLEMEARFKPWDTHMFHDHPAGVGVVSDMGHFVQSCSFSGGVTIGGVTFEGADLLGCRDRSWGVRPLADIPAPGGATARNAMHFWWNPQFEDAAYFIFYTEDADGSALTLDGGIKGGQYDGREWVSLEHTLEFKPGTQLLQSGSVKLTDDHGDVHRLSVEPALPGLYLVGGGYGGLSQGKFMGDHHEGEAWDLGAASAEEIAKWVNDGKSPTDKPALFTRDDGSKGYGMMEFSLRPAYKRYR